MKSVNFKEPRIVLVLMTVLLVLVILFYCVASMITSIGYQTYLENEAAKPVDALSGKNQVTVILDAGHGGEDPGTIGGGLKEKDLNLQVVLKTAEVLKLSGYRVILTRTTDRMLYNSGEENRKKFHDLNNRLKIAKSFPDALFVSIHMNSFPAGSCSGLQTFYQKENEKGRLLADSIQETVKILMPRNRRVSKPDQSIYLLKFNPAAAVLVECGFLSNVEEAKLLSDESYQNRLSFLLALGITNYVKETEHENELCLQPMREYHGEMVW